MDVVDENAVTRIREERMKRLTMPAVLFMALCLLASCSSTRPDSARPPSFVERTLAIKELGADSALVLFAGYIVKPGGNPDIPDPGTWLINLTWGKEIRHENTRLVPYGSCYHGFRLGPLEKVIARVREDPLSCYVPAEIWILTISKEGELLIGLEMGKNSVISDSYAILEFISGPRTGEDTGKLYDDSVFQVYDRRLVLKKALRNAVIVGDENGEETLLRR